MSPPSNIMNPSTPPLNALSLEYNEHPSRPAGDRQKRDPEFLKHVAHPSKSTFPPIEYMRPLIKHFFRATNFLALVVDRPAFFRRFDALEYLTSDSFAGLVLVILALGSKMAKDPTSRSDPADKYSSGEKYADMIAPYYRSFQGTINLEELQGLAFFAFYQFLASRHHPAWITIGVGVRMAQDVGAHRRRPEAPTREAEFWKRTCWIVHTCDVMVSTALGRAPMGIMDEIELELPVELGDDFPHLVEFSGKMITLCKIIFNILTLLYCITKPRLLAKVLGDDYDQTVVMELDSMLNEWFEDMPEELKWNPDTMPPDVLEMAGSMYCGAYNARQLIHRPFIPSPHTQSQPKPSTSTTTASTANPSDLSSSTTASSTPTDPSASTSTAPLKSPTLSAHGPGPALAPPGSNSSMSFPSLAICTNAARSCANVLNAARQRRVTLSPVAAFTAFASGITLLIATWGAKNSGIAIDYTTHVGDIDKCLRYLLMAEDVYLLAGRTADILRELASFGGIELSVDAITPPPVPLPGWKRSREDDEETDARPGRYAPMDRSSSNGFAAPPPKRSATGASTSSSSVYMNPSLSSSSSLVARPGPGYELSLPSTATSTTAAASTSSPNSAISGTGGIASMDAATAASLAAAYGLPGGADSAGIIPSDGGSMMFSQNSSDPSHRHLSGAGLTPSQWDAQASMSYDQSGTMYPLNPADVSGAGGFFNPEGADMAGAGAGSGFDDPNLWMSSPGFGGAVGSAGVAGMGGVGGMGGMGGASVGLGPGMGMMDTEAMGLWSFVPQTFGWEQWGNLVDSIKQGEQIETPSPPSAAMQTSPSQMQAEPPLQQHQQQQQQQQQLF